MKVDHQNKIFIKKSLAIPDNFTSMRNGKRNVLLNFFRHKYRERDRVSLLVEFEGIKFIERFKHT